MNRMSRPIANHPERSGIMSLCALITSIDYPTRCKKAGLIRPFAPASQFIRGLTRYSSFYSHTVTIR